MIEPNLKRPLHEYHSFQSSRQSDGHHLLLGWYREDGEENLNILATYNTFTEADDAARALRKRAYPIRRLMGLSVRELTPRNT